MSAGAQPKDHQQSLNLSKLKKDEADAPTSI